MTHYHFIGIGGTGLSAIARVLFERGEHVSGSDMELSPSAQELIDLGIQVSIGHNAEHVEGADVIIRSSAINDENPEVVAASAKNIPVLKRRDFLAQLTGNQKVIAVAGTHGKTTTTAMIAWCLAQNNIDPSYVIGSNSKNLGKNAAAGNGAYFVIEADEYDNMFLGLSPDILVITNIEHDHPDCFPTEEAYISGFLQLTENMKSGAKIIAFADNPGVKKLLNKINKKLTVFRYGTLEEYDFTISSIHHHSGGGVAFELSFNSLNGDETVVGHTVLALPGTHNAYNACAALAVAQLINTDMPTSIQALRSFSGTGRRFDILGSIGGITIIDDYAHHPTEIRATLAAVRSRYPKGNIWAVWQPHTYSRTQELFNDFKHAFNDCDHVIVTEIYRSREKVQNYSSALLVDEMKHRSKFFIPTLDETAAFLVKNIAKGDIIIVLSAGDANMITKSIYQFLLEKERN